MAHDPELAPRSRSNNQGAAVSDTDVPKQKSAMMSAPSQALADNEATSRAEYSRPQGINAQAMPRMNGALPPRRPRAGRALRQTPCPRLSIQAGCRARQSKTTPSKKAAA